MKKYTPTASLILLKKAVKKSGKYPVRLAIYYAGEKQLFSTKVDLSEDQWQAIHKPGIKDKALKEKKIILEGIRNEAQSVLDGLQQFSFGKFKDAFFQSATPSKEYTFKATCEEYIAFHDAKGSVGTAISYRTMLNSILSFQKVDSMLDITVKFLEDYEAWMLSNGKSITSVGIYLRQLRAVFNYAISKNIVTLADYPFGKRKYQIPASRNIKKALTFEQIQQIINFKPRNKQESLALDYWTFSYLSNGMNFCDIAHLKKENINGDFIHFVRQKTKNTKKGNLQPIKVPIHEMAGKVILRRQPSQGNFLFPILSEGLNALQVKYRIQDFIKDTNKSMEQIRLALGIEQKLNTYSCRHSFATVLKRMNVSTEFISEGLGHSSLQTTQSYLDSFEDKTKVEYSKLLIAI